MRITNLLTFWFQLSNAWEDELHNVVQMNYGTSTASDSQEVNGIYSLLSTRPLQPVIGRMFSNLTIINLFLLQVLNLQVIRK